MKKTLLALGIVAILSTLTFTSEAARTSNSWKTVAGVLQPRNSTQSVSVYDLEITNAFTLSGTAGSGGIDMNNEIITNI